MFNNPYQRNYMQPSPMYEQNMYDQIDNQIKQLQQMKEQVKTNQAPAINQTFQIAPTNNHSMKYANTIEEVNKEIVTGDTPFFSKDLSVMWLKNAKGDIKSYELNEIVLKDDKDIMIENLQMQINELKGMINNDSNDNVDESTKNTKSSNVPIHTTSTKAKK